MGLTGSSTGRNAADSFKRDREQGAVIALAGNPNVGKSTVFNALTNLHQHTGNWAGKTVVNAQGYCKSEKREYTVVDIPGTYSLMAHSAEEEVARDFICFGGADAVAVVCDATCLERNMNLVLQTLEISSRVLLCVNLMDEAARKKISIKLPLLSEKLGIPVIGVSAREKGCRETVLQALDALLDAPPAQALRITYPAPLEQAAQRLLPMADALARGRLNGRWLCLRLLEGDEALICRADAFLGGELLGSELEKAACEERAKLIGQGIDRDAIEDLLTAAAVSAGAEICRDAVTFNTSTYGDRDRKIDRILTGRLWGYPMMLLLLAAVFYITIVGANYPSQWLSGLLFSFEAPLNRLFNAMGAPWWLRGVIVDGAYRVLAWVVSVMLPPMAIFFPLFTLLEDSGYLPRIAYNLDTPFKRCRACGKQALTMCIVYITLHNIFATTITVTHICLSGCKKRSPYSSEQGERFLSLRIRRNRPPEEVVNILKGVLVDAHSIH